MTAAHGNRTVTALEWKPASEWDGALGGGGWLASAGLDKTVKVGRIYSIRMRSAEIM
jgi:hypothetical protein